MSFETSIIIGLLIIAAMVASYLWGFLRGAEKANLQMIRNPKDPLDTMSEALAVNKKDLKKLIKEMARDDHPDSQEP